MSHQNPIIMVIEDENLLLQAISKKLENNDMKPVSCTTAQQALDYLESLPELPDAIWLDFHLGGGMDGLEFMGKLKQNSNWSEIPVVVVSNSATKDKVHSMLALGAKKYLLKAEHRLDDIITTVKEFVQKGE
jgi:CheY-like chemotaxis protein